MSETHEDDRDLLAAELALGLLPGEELAEARRLFARDPEFARLVDRWEARFAPLLDGIPAEEPPPALLQRIREAIGSDNVVELRRRVRTWRGYGAAMTAVAASLALVVGYQATREAPQVEQPQRPAVLVASLSSETQEATLAVAVDPERRSLLVTPTRLAGAAGHDHELWIIPAGGTPISLGIVRAGAPQRIGIDPQLLPHFRPDAGIAVSVEPEGGSPTGQPTGPVIASGALTTI